MRIARIFFPFLFVRNGYSGGWELSHARILIFCAGLVLFLLACIVVALLQAPVEYAAAGSL